jgi:hypothetical protein
MGGLALFIKPALQWGIASLHPSESTGQLA